MKIVTQVTIVKEVESLTWAINSMTPLRDETVGHANAAGGSTTDGVRAWGLGRGATS